MTEVTRRGFVVQASVASAAAAAGATGLSMMGEEPTRRPAGLSPETLVLHVRDLATSEVAVMADTEEIVYRDEKLVTSLLHALDKAMGR